MSRYLLSLVLATTTVIALDAGTSHAGFTVNFDDIAKNNDLFALVPSNYRDMTWDDGWFVMNDNFFSGVNGYGNSYSAPSPKYAASNSNGVTSLGINKGGSTFTFNGAYFASLTTFNEFLDDSSLSVTVEGYRNGSLVYTLDLDFDDDGDGFSTQYYYLDGDSRKIDELRILNDGIDGHFWMVDDMSFTTDTLEAVPAPPAVILAGFGLASMCGLGRFARRKPTVAVA